MAFGKNYKAEYSAPIADNGEYLVKIVEVNEKTKDVWHWLEFKVEYTDGVKRLPDSFSLFEPAQGSGEKGQRAFNIRATAIFECFGLNPDFSEAGRFHWLQKKGRVRVARDDRGYAKIAFFIPKEKSPVNSNDPAADFWG